MKQLIALTTMVIVISLSGSAEEVTLFPVSDISIANRQADDIYDIPGVNKGSHTCLALVNYKC